MLILFLVAAQEKTFEREYTYRASELDSKISCRIITISQLRSMLLNEIGVYVESESILKTSDVSGKFSQDFVENIATISVGITKLEVLEESWNGEIFWMKASITVDKNSLEQSLKQVISDRQKLKELEEVRQKLNDASKEIGRLKEQSVNNQGTHSAQSLKYGSEINTLAASDLFYEGNSKANLQDHKGAIADYTKVIEIKPDFFEAYYNRGYSRDELQNYKGAISDYTKAIEINPTDADAYHNRGISKANLQDHKGAIADYDKAIEIDPAYATAYLNKGVSIASLEDYQGAIAEYNKVISIRPDYAEAYYNRAYVKAELKDYMGAIADYTKALEISPDFAIAYFKRGEAKIRLGQKSSGCYDFSKAGELGFAQAYDAIKRYCN